MIISDIIGIIADDLTDANETALQFHLKGANSQILLDFDSSPQNIKNTQVWAVSTATRNQSPEFAESEVKKAVQLFMETLNLDYFFKKIDSALTGNIGIETLAMLETLDWNAAVVIPACPNENIITVGGYQLVNGVPIEQTELARDNFNPLFESHIPTMIKRQVGEQYADLIEVLDLQTIMKGAGPILQKLNNFVKAGKKLILCDAASTTDIKQIILATNKSDYKFLPVGTSASAQVLADIWLPPVDIEPKEKFIQPLPKLVISGTGTLTTINQLEYLRNFDKYKTKFFDLEMNTILSGTNKDLIQAVLDSLNDNKITVINASTLIHNFDGFSDDSLNAEMTKSKLIEHVSTFLADLSYETLSQKDAILITLGGETSYKCCNAIHSTQLQIIDQVTSSVALTLDHKAQWIVSKSGHIGETDEITDIIEYFDGHTID